ncbi:MAG TPA: bifunctional pyr operon transcriptional regulator/uracil phosphoribosyltransferase PyrR [Anaeromyxobacteraceae bacterium]|nr:bifunctional pyr operon transcriptional regulator/uracil phosphoribosyltransferase PyrR [Anaeromyxobacteraceae bacterium]
MNAEAVGRAVRRIAREVLERAKAAGAEQSLAFVGIRRGGVHLAERLRDEIGRAVGAVPPMGTLDIALYRDDLSQRGVAPVVGPTDIRFKLEGRVVVLADDVLYTGRTVRAALDELVDFGRPRQVWLAVLVDRGGRELPIAADFAGARLEVPEDEDVQVRWQEEGAAEDAVVVHARRKP